MKEIFKIIREDGGEILQISHFSSGIPKIFQKKRKTFSRNENFCSISISQTVSVSIMVRFKYYSIL